jgi:hypothetical protein
MLVEGWRGTPSSVEAVRAIHKHTGFSIEKSRKLVDRIIAGEPVSLPDDFVLREDLQDSGFIIR